MRWALLAPRRPSPARRRPLLPLSPPIQSTGTRGNPRDTHDSPPKYNTNPISDPNTHFNTYNIIFLFRGLPPAVGRVACKYFRFGQLWTQTVTSIVDNWQVFLCVSQTRSSRLAFYALFFLFSENENVLN